MESQLLTPVDFSDPVPVGVAMGKFGKMAKTPFFYSILWGMNIHLQAMFDVHHGTRVLTHSHVTYSYVEFGCKENILVSWEEFIHPFGS